MSSPSITKICRSDEDVTRKESALNINDSLYLHSLSGRVGGSQTMLFIMKVPSCYRIQGIFDHLMLSQQTYFFDCDPLYSRHSRRCSSNQRSQLEMGRKYCSAHSEAVFVRDRKVLGQT